MYKFCYRFAHVFSMDTGTSVGDLIGIGKACNSISFKEQRPFKIVVGCEDKSASFFEGPPFKFKLSLTVISNNNTNINLVSDCLTLNEQYSAISWWEEIIFHQMMMMSTLY